MQVCDNDTRWLKNEKLKRKQPTISAKSLEPPPPPQKRERKIKKKAWLVTNSPSPCERRYRVRVPTETHEAPAGQQVIGGVAVSSRGAAFLVARAGAGRHTRTFTVIVFISSPDHRHTIHKPSSPITIIVPVPTTADRVSSKRETPYLQVR